MNRPDGGPAFPRQEDMQVAPGGERWLSPGSEGMSLLDYFAGQVLEGLVAAPDAVLIDDQKVARYCYDKAEAMVAERARRQEARGV